MGVNLSEYIHPEMDILFVALNAPVNSNDNGHWFTNNLSFWNILYRTGIITQSVTNKLHGDEKVFGKSSINFNNWTIGVTDLIRTVVETDSSKVDPTKDDVNRILDILKLNKVKKLCLMHSKVGAAFRDYAFNTSFNKNRYGKIGTWNETEIYEVPFHNATVANKDHYYSLLINEGPDGQIEKLKELSNKNVPTSKEIKNISSKSFVIPKSGNSITEKDIEKGQLRITVDFKKYFPENSEIIQIKYLGKNYKAKYDFQERRSSILRVGHKFMGEMRIHQRTRLKVSRENGKYIFNLV
ncbi:hypothetical protein [Gillisia sp. Hel_I_29]|uniref:hypothetical protein n=1 Tax=Gillisia sp. Hel_I_29 TaxID=1249975 RepID=UPI00055073E1|nr:hypothetical protein [Gillisia sp. Hel_I_29]